MANLFKLFGVRKVEDEATKNLFDSERFMLEAERPSYIPLSAKRNGSGVENTSKDPRTIRALELRYARSIFE